jgi:hypothetical protein
MLLLLLPPLATLLWLAMILLQIETRCLLCVVQVLVVARKEVLEKRKMTLCARQRRCER